MILAKNLTCLYSYEKFNFSLTNISFAQFWFFHQNPPFFSRKGDFAKNEIWPHDDYTQNAPKKVTLTKNIYPKVTLVIFFVLYFIYFPFLYCYYFIRSYCLSPICGAICMMQVEWRCEFRSYIRDAKRNEDGTDKYPSKHIEKSVATNDIFCLISIYLNNFVLFTY